MIVVVAKYLSVTHRAELNWPGTQYGQLSASGSLDDGEGNGLQVVSAATFADRIDTAEPCVSASTARQLNAIPFTRATEMLDFATHRAGNLNCHDRDSSAWRAALATANGLPNSTG